MVGALKNLTSAERARISTAIEAAGARTHARFSFVAVEASDRYQLYPLIWGASIALLVFGVLALVEPDLGMQLAFIIVMGVFLAASLALEWRPLRLAVVPRHIRRAHARMLAHREFAVRILGHPEHNGGVLFFVSLAERYVEVIADRVLHEKVQQSVWDGIVAKFSVAAGRGRLADAIAEAVGALGALLEEHHPKG